MSGEKLQSFFESIGGIVFVAAVVIVLFVLILKSGSKKKTDTKTMVVCALLTALSVVLGMIVVFRMPQGGSITALSMIPMVLAGYIYGTRRGMMVGMSVGLINLMFNPYVIHPAQLLLDYPIAFGAMALGAPFRDKFGKASLSVVLIVGVLGRWFCSVLSGVIFFSAYAPEGMNAWVYSMVYNISYLGVEGLISLVVLNIPPVRNMMERLRDQAIAEN